MSLLDYTNTTVTVYLEEQVTDSDGNIKTRPSATGTEYAAHVQVAAASGTSARRSEQDNEGYETESAYRLCFPRSFPHVLGAQARIGWRGQYWAVIGDVQEHLGSTTVAHVNYTMRRT